MEKKVINLKGLEKEKVWLQRRWRTLLVGATVHAEIIGVWLVTHVVVTDGVSMLEEDTVSVLNNVVSCWMDVCIALVCRAIHIRHIQLQ